jgi:transposase
VAWTRPPVFIIADRGSGETYAHPAKAAEESTIRLWLGDRRQESMTVYTDGFRAYSRWKGTMHSTGGTSSTAKGIR